MSSMCVCMHVYIMALLVSKRTLCSHSNKTNINVKIQIKTK